MKNRILVVAALCGLATVANVVAIGPRGGGGGGRGGGGDRGGGDRGGGHGGGDRGGGAKHGGGGGGGGDRGGGGARANHPTPSFSGGGGGGGAGGHRPSGQAKTQPAARPSLGPSGGAGHHPAAGGGSRPNVSGGGNRPNAGAGDRPGVAGGGNRPNAGGGSRPDIGGGGRPNTAGGRPDIGGAGKPNVGGANRPDIGGGQTECWRRWQAGYWNAGKPNIGGAGRPDIGGGSRPDIGSSGRPDIGGAGRPDIGGAGRPEIGSTGVRPGAGGGGVQRDIGDRTNVGDRNNVGDRTNIGNDVNVGNRTNIGNDVNVGDRNINVNNNVNAVSNRSNYVNNRSYVNRPQSGWYGGEYRPPYYGLHSNNYHGAWNWARPAATFATGAAFGWLASPSEPIVYSNPYYDSAPETSSVAYLNYSQPISVEVSATSTAPVEVPIESAPADERPAPEVVSAQDLAVQAFDQASASFKAGRFADAQAEVEKALASLPKDTTLHEFRALTLFAQKKYQDSAAAIYAVLAAGPGWNWETMKGFYSSADVYKSQLRDLENFQRANSTRGDASLLLAYHYLTLGSMDAAKKQLQNAVRSQPNDQLSTQLLATLDEIAGDRRQTHAARSVVRSFGLSLDLRINDDESSGGQRPAKSAQGRQKLEWRRYLIISPNTSNVDLR